MVDVLKLAADFEKKAAAEDGKQRPAPEKWTEETAQKYLKIQVKGLQGLVQELLQDVARLKIDVEKLKLRTGIK